MNFEQFVDKIKSNTQEDVLDHRYKGQAPDEFTRFADTSDIHLEVYQHYSKRLIELYIQPIMELTGFRFAVRDYHKGGRKTKKITFMFICSQDRTKQRKSRSNNERKVNDKLKVELCDSRLSLTYNMSDGQVSIYYNHKTHASYGSRTTRSSSLEQFHHQPQRQTRIDYNLQSVANYNNEYQTPQYQFNDQKTAQALAAVATQSYEKPSDKVGDENIDKELIGLQEAS
jgi:hypothetical protein